MACSGFPALDQQETDLFLAIQNILTKIVRSRLLEIGLVLCSGFPTLVPQEIVLFLAIYLILY